MGMHFRTTACPGPVKNRGDESRLLLGCLKIESDARRRGSIFCRPRAGGDPVAPALKMRKDWSYWMPAFAGMTAVDESKWPGQGPAIEKLHVAPGLSPQSSR